MVYCIRTSLLATIAVLCLTGAASAQSPSDSVVYQLSPVTVTATRLTESWLEIPLSLSIVPRSNFAPGKGYGLDEVLAGVPGVLAQSRFGNQDIRLTIRGFGARGAGERSNAGTARGIRVLSDGFPETEPDGRTAFDLLDLSGAGVVEVVRSNASSVWGNAAGGVVNVRSNTMFESPYAQYSSAFGSFGFRKEMVHAGMMLGDGRLALSMSNTNSDGWRYHSQSSLAQLNAAVLAPLGERTTMGVFLSGATNIFRIPGPLSQAQFDSAARQSDSLYIKRDERRFNRLGRIGVTVSHEINDVHSLSASAFVNPKYLQRSERNTFRDFTRYHTGGNLIYQQRLTLSEGVHNVLTVGMDEAYQDGAILFYTLSSTGSRGSTLRDNKREGANNFGAFLQDELLLNDRWSVLFGGRYDNITYYGESFINPKLNDSRSFTRFTPKGGITYRLSPTHSVYANVGGGVEVPAGNETDPIPTYGQDTIYAINPLLDAITSTTVEVGTKQIMQFGEGEWGGSLTYDVALYWLQVNNDIIPYRNGRFYFTAGKTRRMGAELGARVVLTNGLSLDGAFTLSNNKYIEYRVDSVHYSASKAGIFADYADNKVAGVPEVFFNAGVKYSPSYASGAYVRASLQGVSGFYVDDPNRVRVPAWATMNAAIGIDRFHPAGGAFYLSAFVGINNLLDKKYASSAWINPDLNTAGKPVYLEPGLPRNVVGSVSVGMSL
jgi:iron complex outermembrane receptor protein